MATIVKKLAARYPAVPVIYFANGGSAFLEKQVDVGAAALAVDWRVSMQSARSRVGSEPVLMGNIDPIVLYGAEKEIRAAVRCCIDQGSVPSTRYMSDGKSGTIASDSGRMRHVLNLGHGVEKDVPEEAVEVFVDEARQYIY